MKKRGLAALLTLDVVFLCSMAAIGLGFIWDSQRINPTAAALPRYTSVVMIGLILFVLYGKVREAFGPAGAGEPPAAAAKAEPSVEALPGKALPAAGRKLPWYVTWLIIATFPFLVLQLGFSAATFLFLTAVSIIMGTRPVTGLIYGTVGTIALVVLFIFVLKVPMPDSTLGELIPALQGY